MLKKFSFTFLIISCFWLVGWESVRAQSVDLLWQGDGFTHPFFKGKTHWAKQTKITYVAIPHGLGNPSQLIYKWTQNGTVLGNTNGVGKNTLVFVDSVLSRPQTIKIEIISPEEDLLAENTINITPIPQKLAVYEDHPLYGIMFHKEVLGAHTINGQEVTFTAFPFFFSTPNRESGDLSYEWQSNVGNGEVGSSVTYRAPDDVSGSSVINVRVANEDKFVQSADKNFLIEFGI